MDAQTNLNAALLACLQTTFNDSRTDGGQSNRSELINNATAANLGLSDSCSLLIEDYTNQYDNSQYTRELVTYYLMGLGGMTMCCLGLVFNVISLIVLTHKSMRSSTYSYLSALSVCDSVVLLFTILLLVKDVNKPEPGEQRWPWNAGIYPYMFPYVHPAAFTFQVTSVWLTLAFTVDRYIMICHPFIAESFCSISKARKVVFSLFISSLIFNLPKFFEYKTVAIHLPHLNLTKTGCDLTDFGRSHTFRELYHSWLYIMFVCGIPFVALAVLNAFLIHAVRMSRKRGREINAMEKKRNDTTVMLIGVVIIFFICQMPALVSRIIWAFEDNPENFKALPLYLLNEIASFLIVLNSATNIVPYYFFGARFRKQFWKLFCYCLRNYKHFSGLTRTFSLTMLDDDQRRVSVASCRNNVNMINVAADKCGPTSGMLCQPDVGTNGKWTDASSTSVVVMTAMNDTDDDVNKVARVNGNLSDDDAAKHCLLNSQR